MSLQNSIPFNSESPTNTHVVYTLGILHIGEGKKRFYLRAGASSHIPSVKKSLGVLNPFPGQP